MTRTVTVTLGIVGSDSHVLIDGIDVSKMCTGIEISAHVGKPTRITLFMIANCYLAAEAADVDFRKTDDAL